jgi:Cu/Ag efflux pump CusA
VATVVEDHQLLIGDGIVGDQSGLMIVIEKFPDANTLEVTRGVEAALQDLAPGLGNLRIDSTVYRPASFVESAMSNLGPTLLVGLVLAVLLIGLLLFSWRTAVVALVTIPLAVATAVVVLNLFGVTMNLLVVLGLVAALIVVIDDAVRDPQAILRGRPEGAGANGERMRAVVRAAVAMRRPAVYATLVVALAVTPVFFIPGSPGAFVAPLAVAYLVGLASAMLVALLVTPALASLLPRTAARRDAPAVRLLHRGYDWLGRRRRAVPRARTAVVAGVVVVVAGAAMLPVLATSLMPTLREPDLLIEVDASAGVARPEMARITAAASAELRALPGVSQVGAHVGRGLQSDQITDVDSGEIWVRMDPAADYDATVAAVQEVVDGYPGLGLQRAVTTYLTQRSGSLLTDPETELLVRVYGEDSAVLSAKADEVQGVLAGVEGLQNATVQQVPLRPTLQVEVDLAKAQQFNIKPGDVRRTVATLLSGIEVGSIFEDQKVFEVIVWGTPELRHSATGVQNLLVDRPDGQGQVRVGDVAEVRIAPAPAVIQRDASSRYLDVTATVAGRSYGAVAAEVRDKLRAVQFPFEHRAEIIGEHAARQDALWQVVGVAGVALVLIYLLLQAATRSWWLALVAFASLPVTLAGGAVAAAIGGRIVSLGTLLGLVAVAALGLKQTLSLLGSLQERRAAGEAPGPELVARVVRDHLGPIATSTLAVAAAVLPIVVVGPEAGLELLHPMAVAILGGLVTAALLNLVVVPGVYAARAGRQEEDLEITLPAQSAGEPLVPTGSRA